MMALRGKRHAGCVEGVLDTPTRKKCSLFELYLSSLNPPSPFSSISTPPSSSHSFPATSLASVSMPPGHHLWISCLARYPLHIHLLKSQRHRFLHLFGKSTFPVRSLKSVTGSASLRGVGNAVGSNVPLKKRTRKRNSGSGKDVSKGDDTKESKGKPREAHSTERMTTTTTTVAAAVQKHGVGTDPYDLPRELWIYIFQLAADSPHPFLSPTYGSPTSSSSPPVSFLHYSPSNAHLYYLYKAQMRTKANFTLVSKKWHDIALEILYGFVWIARREDAERLVGVLDRKCLRDNALRRVESNEDEDKVFSDPNPVREGEGECALIRTKNATKMEKRVGRTRTSPDTRNLGQHIRRLHIELIPPPSSSPSSSHISTFDLVPFEVVKKILAHATGLWVFSDAGRGVRGMERFSVSSVCGLGSGSAVSVVSTEVGRGVCEGETMEQEGEGEEESLKGVLPYTYATSTSTTSISTFATSSPDDLFDTASVASSSSSSTLTTTPSSSTSLSASAFMKMRDDNPLLSTLLPLPSSHTTTPSLTHLSLTSYSHPCTPSPSLESLTTPLAFDPVTGRPLLTQEERVRMEKQHRAGEYFARVVGQRVRGVSGGLEFLEVRLCKGEEGGDGWLDGVLSSPSPPATCGSGPSVRVGSEGAGAEMSELGGGDGEERERVCLPRLTSLKVTLDSAAFRVLAGWDMPNLTNLSVISADFSYAGDGFREFFEAHGHKIIELELGHSTEDIEDHYHYAGAPSPFSPLLQSHSLAAWCPNLKKFICSAEAVWNWYDPNRIAPHALLPAHPGVEFIGVRGLERRLREGVERS
ncbi:hypothetical protein NMY22_g19872 [Coprinellus aureogranulatus]|nr:hypothetical protein NMY22_g19872 [Coprinellus aureogranulatus]